MSASSFVRARHALVLEHAEIQERELIQLASLTAAITKALHARGVAEPIASLAAEAGIGGFKVGFRRWLEDKRPHGFAAHIRAAIDALKAIAVARSTPRARPKKKARQHSPSRRRWDPPRPPSSAGTAVAGVRADAFVSAAFPSGHRDVALGLARRRRV